jgi:tartrate dehydrogenase/decarboxylase/D-malate dehydrogenase
MPAAPLRVALIPGDGIGAEVLEQGVRVLEALEAAVPDLSFAWTELDWGSARYLEHGAMMPPDGVERLRGLDAIYFGAVGWPSVPDHVTLWGLRLPICQGLDQWANVRPVRLYEGLPARLRLPEGTALDWVVVRENSEGEYAGIGGRQLAGRGPGHEVAIESSLFTAHGCERILRFAFEMARARPRRRLTSVTKSNAQRYGMVLWDETFERVRSDYPDVEADSRLVDAMAARFVLHPEELDVVVGSNLFGDILSDLGGALAGSLGLAPSANLDPERRAPSMFEPVHGSAPDIAGRGIANPLGAIASAAMMLEHLGRRDEARRVDRAVAATIRDGVLTPDLGGTRTCADVGGAVARRLETVG